MASPPTRRRNRRGEGGKLRGEILAAAAQLLEETGSEDAVTLSAIARRCGISAPSIYQHFPGREAIVDAVVDDTFNELGATIRAALDAHSDPLARITAGCAAYLRFAAELPNRYRIIFSRHIHIHDDPAEHPRPLARRQATFELLVTELQNCVQAGISTSQDPFADATALLVALHGYATMRAAITAFPWPTTDAMLDRLIHGLAHISHDT